MASAPPRGTKTGLAVGAAADADALTLAQEENAVSLRILVEHLKFKGFDEKFLKLEAPKEDK